MTIRYLKYIFGVLAYVAAVALTRALLTYLGAPAGDLRDWTVGGVAVPWLLIVVTVPWNLYFEAAEIRHIAEERGADAAGLSPRQVAFATRIGRRALVAAVLLHLVSAGAFYWVAASGVSEVGYLGAASAVILMALRPTLRAYDYLSARLAEIRRCLAEARVAVEPVRRPETPFDETELLVEATDLAIAERS